MLLQAWDGAYYSALLAVIWYPLSYQRSLYLFLLLLLKQEIKVVWILFHHFHQSRNHTFGDLESFGYICLVLTVADYRMDHRYFIVDIKSTFPASQLALLFQWFLISIQFRIHPLMRWLFGGSSVLNLLDCLLQLLSRMIHLHAELSGGLLCLFPECLPKICHFNGCLQQRLLIKLEGLYVYTNCSRLDEVFWQEERLPAFVLTITNLSG